MSNPDGRPMRGCIAEGHKVCPKCLTDKNLNAYYPSKTQGCGYSSWCRDCCSTYSKNDGRERRARSARTTYLKTRYGIRTSDVEGMIIAQAGKCAICKTILDDPHVDHSHGSEELRGMLCHSCNTGLGHFRDNPSVLQAAIEYLRPAVKIEIL